jgi:hypothetical protein
VAEGLFAIEDLGCGDAGHLYSKSVETMEIKDRPILLSDILGT